MTGARIEDEIDRQYASGVAPTCLYCGFKVLKTEVVWGSTVGAWHRACTPVIALANGTSASSALIELGVAAARWLRAERAITSARIDVKFDEVPIAAIVSDRSPSVEELQRRALTEEALRRGWTATEYVRAINGQSWDEATDELGRRLSNARR